MCSGNGGVSPIVQAQATSLSNSGLIVEVFSVNGKGITGYLKAIPRLTRKLKRDKPDVIHAHYSLSGIVAAVSSRKPIVTSLMGSDVIQSGWLRMLITFFVKYVWAITIVKSEDMKNRMKLPQILVLPNGVDFDLFKPIDKLECKSKLGWDANYRQILFAADPNRPEKNFTLAKQAFEMCREHNLELKVVYGIPQAGIPFYLNASDVVLLSSLWEGSPNVVKEAMACNVSVVATDVGDVKMLFGSAKGYIIVKSDPVSMCEGIVKTLNCDTANEGRDRLQLLGIDSYSTASKLVSMYQNLGRDNAR